MVCKAKRIKMPKSHSDFKAITNATCFGVFDVLKWHSSTLTVKYKLKPTRFFVGGWEDPGAYFFVCLIYWNYLRAQGFRKV